METITNSSNTVATIKKVARKMVKTMMPHMKDLIDADSSELLESFIDGYNVQIPPSDALTLLQNTTVEMISDAESVLKEIGIFGPAYVKGTISSISPERIPFMLSVWNGDMYDVVEDEALNELISDLLTQEKEITEDTICEKTAKLL